MPKKTYTTANKKRNPSIADIREENIETSIG